MNPRIFLVALLPFLPTLTLCARTRVQHWLQSHEVRIGWGDQLFEQIVWHNTGARYVMPASFSAEYKENYRYSQHWYAQYLYSCSTWFAVGGMFDYSGVSWDLVERNGLGKELHRDTGGNFYNLAFLVPMRFTYLHSRHYEMYAELSGGINLNGGSETDEKGRHKVFAPVVDFRLIGMRFNWGQWSVAGDVGGMVSLKDLNTYYMVMSRLFTVSVGYSF